MKPDPETRLEQIFCEAAALGQDHRQAYLKQRCGDDGALLSALEELLREHDESSGYLDRPAWKHLFAEGSSRGVEAMQQEPEDGLPFERLGEFRLLRRLGEGGMGTVYLAIQEPLGRPVALKVIRPERSDSPEAVLRFQREAEAISRLRHPGIVTLYAVGEDQGARFLAMELVSGQGLNDLLRARLSSGQPISMGSVVGWVHDVACALGSAHAEGVIHRDVKPSNIRIGDDGRAMLMDFGIARQLDLSTLTVSGSFRGTPYYSSPEQIRARSKEMDGRTDVYSLGVTLYEALAGRVPFQGETTEQVFHQILAGEPVAPRRLNPSISRDLEVVILTAMELDRSRRYSEMAEFARDLVCVREGRPIHARPPGVVTSSIRRLRRHPTSSAAIAVGLVALLGFLLYVLAWSLPQLRDERNLALEAGELAEAQKTTALLARDAAQAARERAETTLDFLLDMLSSADPSHSKGKEITVLALLDASAQGVDQRHGDQPVVAAAIHDIVASTYGNLGREARALPHARSALALRIAHLGPENPDTLASKHVLAVLLVALDHRDESFQVAREALDGRREVLGAEHSKTLESSLLLVRILRERGEPAEAVELLENLLRVVRDAEPTDEALVGSVLGEYGRLLHDQARYDEAGPILAEALEILLQARGLENTATLSVLGNLAMNLQEQGHLEEALEKYRQSIEGFTGVYGPEHANTLTARSGLAYLYQATDRLAEARQIMEEVLAIQRRVLGSESIDVLASLTNLSSLIYNQGFPEEALSFAEEGTALAERILPERDFSRLMMLAVHGTCLRDLGRLEQAEQMLLEAYQGFEGVAGRGHPITRQAAKQLHTLYNRLGREEEADRYQLWAGESQ